ncbi:hypothetical protein RJ641_022291 [Dillenia turbinata]|uniref:WHIM1 domain-containing protein n=1 Tax=Dillenia turbinata TaxID=194707 RepID=A0AAN8YU63_9MAGN
MAETRRRGKEAVIEMDKEPDGVVKNEKFEDPNELDFESARLQLRQRWELASVINFLHVFEPVWKNGLKISAEEIEDGLIKPNNSLSELHIMLLKGIPPVNKSVNTPDAWVTALCKKLATWWPWVAEGELPLAAAKGEEIPRYKQLDSTTRLLLLKALCEVRADQEDIVAYINDSIKTRGQIDSFRKDKLAGDGNGITYWYDGNPITGHRLYKEVKSYESTPKKRRKGSAVPPILNFKWETLATNLEEFLTIADKYASNKGSTEASVSKTVKADVIPVLEKIQKMTTTRLLTRQYKIQREPGEHKGDQKNVRHSESGDSAGNEGSDVDVHPSDSCKRKWDSVEDDFQTDKTQEGSAKDEDTDDDDYDGETDNNSDEDGHDSGDSDKENDNLGNKNIKKYGVRWSNRLAGNAAPPVGSIKLGTKNRSRQRPIRITAMDPLVVSDSDDEVASTDTGGSLGDGRSSPNAARVEDSEIERSSEEN